MSIEGSRTKEVFEAHVGHFLAPELKSGRVVVMDNLSAHKGERVRKLTEHRGCELLYLPPYSPDLNPIEEAFSKVKWLLRGIGPRTREVLWWRPWVRRSMRSVRRTQKAFSLIAFIAEWNNNYERRCKNSGTALGGSGLVKW